MLNIINSRHKYVEQRITYLNHDACQRFLNLNYLDLITLSFCVVFTRKLSYTFMHILKSLILKTHLLIKK